MFLKVVFIDGNSFDLYNHPKGLKNKEMTDVRFTLPIKQEFKTTKNKEN